MDSSLASGVNALAVADLNADGAGDIAAAFAAGLAWYDNTAADGTSWSKTSFGAGADAICAADVVGDSGIDIVALKGTALSVWENVSNASSFTEVSIAGTASVDSITAVDLDGDGDLEIAGVISANGDLLVWEKNGVTWDEFQFSIGLTGVAQIAFTDLDGDGDQDLMGSSGTGTVGWWENVPDTTGVSRWQRYD